MTTRSTYTTEDPAVLSIRKRLVFAFSRISWSSVIAGVLIALVVDVALSLLGLALGAATIDPAYEATPVDPSLATGAVIWTAATILLSTFAGGWVAGRVAGQPDASGILHGLLVWTILIVIQIVLLFAGVGRVVNSALTLVDEAATFAMQPLAEASPDVARAEDMETTTFDRIEEEAVDLMRGGPTEGVDTEDVGNVGLEPEPYYPNATQTEAILALQRVLRQGEDADDADRQVVIAALAAEGDISEAEAEEILQRWENVYDQVQTTASERAEEAAQAAADALAAAAGIAFAGMVVGAFGAGAGGMVGSPEESDLEVESVEA
jgi:hypothetical protein